MKKYRFEAKGRRSLDMALEHGTATMTVSEKTLTRRAVVRATCWRWIACCCLPMNGLGYDGVAKKRRRGTQKARTSARPAFRLHGFTSLAAGVVILAATAANGGAAPRAPLSVAPAARTHVFGNPSVWHWPPGRTYHVENYKLRLRFDQAKGEVFGDEVITLRPFQSHFHQFYLDSSALQTQAVTLLPSDGAPIPLRFARQDPHLWITLNHDYSEKSLLKVRIVYRGFPKAGLYFVNPTSHYPNWPREIWSQGEAETNHFWFPCWDYPNDMATSETITTVPGGQSVVSNGKLVKVIHASGQTTFDWVESVPHSSYLTSIAVGPWRKVSDSYHGKPVDYYVRRSVDRATALRSFHLTPDMLAFFSRATGVEYPYEQYAQVTVQNYLYGGMENVSATTLTAWTLHDAPADADYPSTGLVSHELGQHWFGDLVQGRDWADIWLNEGFATYLSALYTQYHEGNDAFRFEIYHDQLVEQAQQRDDYLRPIVDRHYADPMQMFDAITHQKGAAVLEMLRYILDGTQADSQPATQQEPFFQALHYYLTAHRAGTADTADLIQAIRRVTGRELGGFFHQWVFMAGHPDYHVQAVYNSVRKVESITVRQVQPTGTLIPVFDMPVELAFFGANGEHKMVQVRDDRADQKFDVPLDFEPRWVDFDPDDFIDKEVEFDKSPGALIAQAEKDPSMMSRLWATQQLGAKNVEGDSAIVNALSQVLHHDTFWGVRAAAAASLAVRGSNEAKSALLSALNESDSRARAAIVEALGHYSTDPSVFATLVKRLGDDPSYAVEAAAAQDLGRSGVPQALDELGRKLSEHPEVHVAEATLDGLAETHNAQAAAILIESAHAGQPERLRLSALAGLAQLADVIPQRELRALNDVIDGAQRDPFALVQHAGEQLAEALHRAPAH